MTDAADKPLPSIEVDEINRTLRIPAGRRVILVDKPAPAGTAHWATYNHATVTKPRWRDVMPVKDGMCVIAWGTKGNRRGLVVPVELADILVPLAEDDDIQGVPV